MCRQTRKLAKSRRRPNGVVRRKKSKTAVNTTSIIDSGKPLTRVQLAAVGTIQALVRSNRARNVFRKAQRAAVKLQSWNRSSTSQARWRQVRAAVLLLQQYTRVYLSKRWEAAVVLQARGRRLLSQNVVKRRGAAVISVQAFCRIVIAKFRAA